MNSGRVILDKAAAGAAEAGLAADAHLIEINPPGRRIPEVIAEHTMFGPPISLSSARMAGEA